MGWFGVGRGFGVRFRKKIREGLGGDNSFIFFLFTF